eukprot:XP_001698113.1 predicted protein [Chlamydomonas reinhardtii]
MNILSLNPFPATFLPLSCHSTVITMGATKSLPVIGEILTTLESGEFGEVPGLWEKVWASHGELCNSLPLVGHAKAIAFYAAGRSSEGDACMRAATRSLVVLAAAVTAGYLGAMAAGIATDCVTTAIDSACKRRFEPSGLLGAINSAVQSGGDALAVADCLLAVAADLINARRPLARHAAAAMRAKASEAYLYRAANTAEVAEAVRKNTLVPAFGARGRRASGRAETCVSESVKHTADYLPRRQKALDLAYEEGKLPEQVELKAMRLTVGKAEWERIKAKAVPQELANANKDIIPNVYTREVLKDTAAPERKVNVNIKNANLSEAQSVVKKVEQIDLNDPHHFRSGPRKALERYGKHVVLGAGGELLLMRHPSYHQPPPPPTLGRGWEQRLDVFGI